MSKDNWVLRVYNRHGDLMERLEGPPEAELRDQGQCSTTVRGQLGWRCDLYKNGIRVAVCRRGAWKGMTS